jgi:voltage-gated sodium channel
MYTIQKFTHNLVESGIFRYFILFLILTTGVIVGLETYPTINSQYEGLFHIIDQVIIYIFLVEIVLKLLSMGQKPWEYFQDPWNVFDFIIVAVCFIPTFDAHFVAVLRMARILRVFRVISIFPKLQILVNALLKSIPSMGYVVVLLFLIFYIYAVMGSFIFAEGDPVHFGSLHLSMITLFKVLTLEGWTDILNIQIYGSTDPSAKNALEEVSYWSLAYFISFILLGAMIIMNLFIGVIMNSMQESHAELEKSLLQKEMAGSGTQGVVKNLEFKIDELKKDIQKLSELLNKQ